MFLYDQVLWLNISDVGVRIEQGVCERSFDNKFSRFIIQVILVYFNSLHKSLPKSYVILFGISPKRKIKF